MSTQKPRDVTEVIAGDIHDNQIREMHEKPVTRHVINAGIYMLRHEALAPGDRAFDMPELFDACRAAGLPRLAYPIQGYWVDIGQVFDFQRANEEFDQIV